MCPYGGLKLSPHKEPKLIFTERQWGSAEGSGRPAGSGPWKMRCDVQGLGFKFGLYSLGEAARRSKYREMTIRIVGAGFSIRLLQSFESQPLGTSLDHTT